MNFTVIHQEKKLLSFYIQALKEYHKRLQRYCKLQMISCPSFNQLQKKINSNTFIIGITINPSTYTSEEFANYLSHLAVTGQSRITFIINPTSEVLKLCHEKIALSSLTSSNGLLLTILYEQIYRSYRINLNQAYHK